MGWSFGFLAAEGLLRIIAASQSGGKGQVERDSYTEYDPVLGWRKRPGARVTYVRRDYRAGYTVNAQGLRGPERPYSKPPGTVRVLALGDSFVEAFMVSEEETVTARLEIQLRRRLACVVEVVNAGTVGYSTDQEYLFYRQEGRRYSADVVILFTYHNDLPFLVRDRYYGFPKPRLNFDSSPPRVVNEPVPAYRPEPSPPAAPTPAFTGSRVVEFIKHRIERSSARTYNRLASWGLWEPLRILPPNDEINLYRVPPLGHLNPAWSAYTWTVESLEGLVRQQTSRLVIAYIPSRMEVNDSDYEVTEARYSLESGAFNRAAVRDRIATISRHFSVPFLDFTRPLREGTGRFRPGYYPTDSHWNARGQAIAAEAAAAFLADQELLTCPAR